jgi:predicted Zn-dependent protease
MKADTLAGLTGAQPTPGAREGALTDAGYFAMLADALCRTDLPELAGHDVERVALAWSGESSAFVRFNHARVRQATHVRQGRAVLSVVRGQRRIQGAVTLTGDASLDLARLHHEAAALGAELDQVVDDPHLLLAPPSQRSQVIERGVPPDAAEVIRAVADAAADLDFVGIHAAGPVARGYADSTGSRHWHLSETFHLDWCLYTGSPSPELRDKAVKSSLAGRTWDAGAFHERVRQGAAQLPLLREAPRTLPPGRYRAAFSPAAMGELLDTLSWSGFSARERQHGTSSLTLLDPRPAGSGGAAGAPARLDPRVSLSEATAAAGAPRFTADGFVKPERVLLVDHGQAAGMLASARSAQEFRLQANGADEYEAPDALRLEAGTLPAADLLGALDTGLYISNLWYLNYSDRNACRMTGMTRFACFWVERGRLAAPLAVMRFDDSLLRMLGPGLVALTDTVECLPDAGTYGGRQLASVSTPAAIVDDFALTL